MTITGRDLAQRVLLAGEDLSAGTIQWGRRAKLPPPVGLTDRDLRLLATLHGANFLAQSQLVVLGWGASRERAAQMRLSVVDKPRQPPTRRPQPLEPLTVESIRMRLRQRDATLISMLAYAGLRPDEATSARWADLGERILHVHAGKTERARVVELLAPLAQDLAEWRLAMGRPSADTLIFPRAGGGEWQLHDWQNWRRRIYQPGAAAAGVTGDMRPYRLRSSFVSLLLWEGRSLTYAADQAGHSVATLAGHYAGVMRELEDQPRTPAAEAIRNAREAARRAPDVRQARAGV